MQSAILDEDLLKNIQENEDEIGPVDDEEEEQPVTKDDIMNDDLQILGFIDNEQIGDGVYYDGDEPEDDDSQDQIDDQENFSDGGEEGEDESVMGEEGEEETVLEKPKMKVGATKKKSELVAKEAEDSHSKVSTACTNEEQLLFKIKLSSSTAGADGRNKKKFSMKMKKGSSKPSNKD